MFQLVSEAKEIPACFHRAVGYFSVLLKERGSGTLGQSLELREFTDYGPREKGRLPRAHIHSHTPHAVTRHRQAQGHIQKSAPTNTYLTCPPTLHYK